MSELQLALSALAALALLALYLGEKWQEHRRLRRLRERLHGGVGDALLQTQEQMRGRPLEPVQRPAPSAPAAARSASDRVDPFLAAEEQAPGGSGAPAEQGGGAPGVADAGDAGEAAVTSEALTMPGLLLRPDWAEDPLLDCSLEIRCARAVDGVSVIDAAARLGHASWKLPVHFVVWDGRHQQWALPDRFGYYTDALASIQLADRRACIDEAEIARFVQVVQQMAHSLGADVDLPDPARLVAQARELDRLCARFDIRIGLTVEGSGATWTGPQLRNAAHECGFVVVGNQRWVRRQDDLADGTQGLDLYSLQVDPADKMRLALELDIALAPVSAHAFGSMLESARGLAAALGGRVVDDNGRPIEPASVLAIEQQLAQVFEQMRAAGIEPGGTRARRLYA